MAFTLAHMAAALPFYRCQKWLNVEAVFIGTMLPDLPYFLNSAPIVAQHSHQWAGLWQYCLPWGLVVFTAWYWLLKPAAVALLQPWARVGCLESTNAQAPEVQYPFGLWFAARLKFYWNFWFKVILGVLLGAITHLLWDGITHPDGFIAQHIGWLQQPVGLAVLNDMSLARLLQYVSSLMGLAYLGWFIHRRMPVAMNSLKLPTDRPLIVLKKWNSLFIVFLMCAISLFCGWQAMLKWHNLMIHNSYPFLAEVLVGLLQGGIGFFIFYAVSYQILYWVLKQKHRYPSK